VNGIAKWKQAKHSPLTFKHLALIQISTLTSCFATTYTKDEHMPCFINIVMNALNILPVRIHFIAPIYVDETWFPRQTLGHIVISNAR
jgi:hypothetical protein